MNDELVTSKYGETTVSDFIARFEADLEVAGEGSLAGAEIEFADGTRTPMTDTEKAIIHKLLPLRFWDKVEVMRFAIACRRVHGTKTVAEVVELCGTVDVDALIESAPRIKAVGDRRQSEVLREGGTFGLSK